MSDPRALKVLAAAARVLRKRDVRWYVFGAQAVIVWGRPRMSADADITVELDPSEGLRLLEQLRAEGFIPRKEEGLEGFLEQTRVLPLLHAPTRFPLDVVFAGPGLEEGFLDRARQVEMGGAQIPVISPEDLLIGKILAGRPKDIEDVRGVLETQGEGLDLERVREILTLLEQALDRRDLVDVLVQEMLRIEVES